MRIVCLGVEDFMSQPLRLCVSVFRAVCLSDFDCLSRVLVSLVSHIEGRGYVEEGARGYKVWQ